MRYVQASFVCLLALLAGGGSPARAQNIDDAPGQVVLDDISGSMALSNDGGSYLLFQKMVGDGAGFSSPYQRIGMRYKLWDFGTSHLFGETHFVITDHSRVGVNVGGGYRWLANGGVLGVNGWYDSIETDYGNRFQTVGFGFEALHRDTDLRGNVYIPVGEDEGFVRLLDLGTQPVFTQNIFGTIGTVLFERNTTAFDLEAGTAVPGIDWLRMYAGPYFMATSGEDDTWGVRARAEARFSRDINLNFIVTEDDSFGTNLNLGIEVKFSGGLPTRIAAVTNPYDRRYDQVRRQWAGQVRQIRQKVPVPLLDPRDGQPLNIVWVDNTNGAPGSGTYEDPYQALPDVADGADYILVRTGAGDTTGNIVLQDGQFLFGEGRQFAINTDRLGLVPIPETYFANSGPRPTLVAADPAQNVITLANNNVVSNFDIFGGTAAAIGGNGITNFNIEYIAGTAADGINIANYTGLGVLRDSQFYPSAGGRGVFISNTGGGLLDVDDVTTDGGAIGMHLVAQNDPFGVTIDNYTGDNHTDSGLVLEAMGGEMIAEVTDASIFNSTGVTGRGFRLDVSNGGRLDAVMENILAEGAGNLFEGNATDGILNASVTNATLAGSTGGSGAVLNLSNATGVTTFDTIDASGNAVDGIRAVADNGSNYGLNVLDSNVSGNVDDNIQTDAFGGSTLATFVDPTDASGAVTGNGYEFSVDGGSLLTARFLEVDLSGNNSNAILGRVEGGSSAQLDFDIFDASQSVTGAGFNLFVNNGSTVVGTFNDGTFDNNATTNVLASALSGSSIDLTFDNVTADGGATLGGYIVNAIDGSTIGSSWSNGSISNTNADGVSANVAGPAANSEINLAFDNVTIDGNAGHGIDGLVNGDAQDAILNIALANSSVSGNTGDGLRLDLTGNGSVTQVDIAGTPMTNNGDDGVEFSVANGATLVFNATNGGTDLSDNGAGTGSGSAINGYVTGAGSTAILNIDGVNAHRSAGNGAQFIVDLDGVLVFNYANGSISNSGGTGIASTVAGGATAFYNISNTSLNNNAGTVGGLGDGFQVIADDGSMVFASFNEVSANDNARNGFLFIANDGSSIDVDFANNTATAERNGENGLAFDVLLGSSFSLNLTGGSFSNNGVNGNFSGVRGEVDGAGSSADVAFDGTLVDNNTLHGFEFLVQNGGRFDGSLDSTTGTLSASDNAASGVSFQATDAGTMATLLMSGDNQFNSNGLATGADGIDADGTDADQFVVGVSGSANFNGGDGVNITMTNVGAGAIDIQGGGVSTIDDNLGNGINIDLTDTTLNDTIVGSTPVSGLNISDYVVDNNGNNGIRISAVAGSNIGSLNIDNNLIDENGANGIEFLISDSTLPDGSGGNVVTITNNSITNNANDGVSLVNPDTDGNGIAMLFDTNTITGNVAGAGLNLSFNDSAGDIDATVTNNDISSNGADGVSLAAREAINVAARFDGNTISDNSALGVDILARDNVVLDLDFGQDGTITTQNMLDGNVDAGIGIQLFDNVAATLDVANTVASNTIDGGNTLFDGDGLRVITNDTSSIAGVTIGDAVATNTTFTGNAGRGLSFEVGQGSSVLPVTIQNVDASSNGDDGIQFVRFADAVLDDITIANSTINSNGGDGIAFDLQGGGLFLIDATLSGNELNSNSGNGINLNLDADVRLLADINDNEIADSGLSGIRARTQFDSQLDGIWDNNFITNSGTVAASDGILVQATERSMVGQNTGLFIMNSEVSGSSRDGIRVDAGNSALLGGLPAVSVSILDNSPQSVTDTRGITGNAGSGVNLIAGSSADLTAIVDNNVLSENGLDGLQVTKSGAAQLTVGADDNLISENGRHGVNLNTSGTSSGAAGMLTAVLSDNQVLRNAQRGISLVNTGDADAALVITGSVDPRASLGADATSRVEQNGEVGIYIENNAGALNTDNDIYLELTNTAVIGNGTNTGVTADNRNGVWIRVGTSSDGAVNAEVDQNFMSGNGNIDFVTQSFTATPDPNVTSQYTNPGGFTPDPLARFGLLMTNNTGDSADVTRYGATYSNADEFKSPLAIFTSTSRLRNAQRFATDSVVRVDSVQAAPAPTTTLFAGAQGGIGPNNTLVGLGVTISGVTRNVTAFNGGNNAITINPGLGAAPGVGANFTLLANAISGTGDSTFRTNVTSLASGNPLLNAGNMFTTVINDFDDGVNLIDGPGGNPDDNPSFYGRNLNFEWEVLANPFY